MPYTTPTSVTVDQLPIQVLELHIHDEDVCANCEWPLDLCGRCCCEHFEPKPSLFVICNLDTLATRAANGLGRPSSRTAAA